MKFIFSKKKETKIPKEKSTDLFADSLALDFKRVAIEEILNQLHATEGKYLSSILNSSYFPIDLITFHPLDKATALETEEFFRIHTEINANFEDSFFSGILLKDYQTNHGAKAKLTKDCSISIQPGMNSLDDPTSEEAYQISLRGNRKKFSATVKLGTLKPNEAPSAGISSPIKNEPVIQADSASSFQPTSGNQTQLAIQISDANGERQVICSTPLIVGRDAPSAEMQNMEKVNVSAMYISRNQLNIFELNNIIYAFIPKDAKLSGVSGRRGILKNMHLYEINDDGLQITFGQPFDIAHTVADPSSPNLYPTIHIKLAKNQNKLAGDQTPIPSVRK